MRATFQGIDRAKGRDMAVISGPRMTGKTTRLVELWRESHEQGRPYALVVPNAVHAILIADYYTKRTPTELAMVRETCWTAEQVAKGRKAGIGVYGLLVDEWARLTPRQQGACLEYVTLEGAGRVVAVTQWNGVHRF